MSKRDEDPIIRRVKKRAKEIKKGKGITHTEALNVAAVELKFRNWQHLMNTHNNFKRGV